MLEKFSDFFKYQNIFQEFFENFWNLLAVGFKEALIRINSFQKPLR